MQFKYKYKKINSGRLDRARSIYGPPGVPRLYHYAKSLKDTCLHAINPPQNSSDAGGGSRAKQSANERLLFL
ncbi:hypothetical protein N9J83_06070 [Opitutales bacterium]|nr:hypothetical protein [Opitutales bacterium]